MATVLVGNGVVVIATVVGSDDTFEPQQQTVAVCGHERN